MKTLYFNGKAIPCEMVEAMADTERTLKQFANDRFVVELRVKVSVEIAEEAPDSVAKPVVLRVFNHVATDPEGNPIKPQQIEDITETRHFRTIEEGVAGYSRFLLANGAATGDGALIKEIGNQLTPPDPDVPVIEQGSAASEIAGSW